MTDIATTIGDLFKQKTVAIIGDLVADQYLNGTISRVSREAPVFILRHDETATLPGAAANAAANVASIGGKAVVVGLVGGDLNGTLLVDRLTDMGVDCSKIIRDQQITTTTKVRILAGQQHASRQQVIRVDYENKVEPAPETMDALRSAAIAAAGSADAIIISDYNYGVAEGDIFDKVLAIADKRGIPLLVDSRFRLGKFRGSTAATPNQDEAEQLLNPNFQPADCERLCSELGLKALLVTNGNKGMLLVEQGWPTRQIDAVGSSQAVDVTGAGDAVIAAFALALASGLSYFESATIANHAGGIVVMKKGTAVVTTAELLRSLKMHSEQYAAMPAE